MPELSHSQEAAIEAAREIWRRGGTKAEGVAVGKTLLDDATPAGYRPQLPGHRTTTIPKKYVPITTREEADKLVNYLAEYGNYPIMSRCEAAGINGDAADGCPFFGEDFCHCDPIKEA